MVTRIQFSNSQHLTYRGANLGSNRQLLNVGSWLIPEIGHDETRATLLTVDV